MNKHKTYDIEEIVLNKKLIDFRFHVVKKSPPRDYYPLIYLSDKYRLSIFSRNNTSNYGYHTALDIVEHDFTMGSCFMKIYKKYFEINYSGMNKKIISILADNEHRYEYVVVYSISGYISLQKVINIIKVNSNGKL